MFFLKYFVLSICAVYLIIIITLAARSKKAFKYLAYNSLLGLFTLLMLYYTRKVTLLFISINYFTIGFCSFYGVVGVIFILILNLII